MVADMILETLDSLWFFSNILSPSSPVSSTNGNSAEGAQPIHPSNSEQPKPNIQIRDHPIDPSNPEQPQPNIQIPQPQLVESPNTWIQVVTTSSEPEQQMLQAEIEGVPKHPEESNMELKRKKRSFRPIPKRTQRSYKVKGVKEVVEFMDLGFSFDELGSHTRFTSVLSDNRRMLSSYGLHGSGKPFPCKIPPLADGFAMKKHIKSWAHAVACTVR